jgi:hypothetical protein
VFFLVLPEDWKSALRITAAIIAYCLMTTLYDLWFEYCAFIEQDVPYSEAIQLFKDEPVKPVPSLMVERDMNMQR